MGPCDTDTMARLSSRVSDGAVACLALAALLGCVGCERAQGAASGAGGCRFGPEHVVASAVHPRFDGLQLVRGGAGMLSLWSEPSGLYARPLATDGRPRGAARRLAARCAGGLAAVSHTGDVWVACLRPREEASGAAGELTLYTVDPAMAAGVYATLPGAGRLSAGVGLALDGEALHLVWLDADAEMHRVRHAVLPTGRAQAAPAVPVVSTLSDPGHAAGRPDVLATARGVRFAWREAFLREGEPAVEVVVAAADGRPGARLPVVEPSPTPRLAEAQGALYVAYRDRRRRGARTGLHVQRLGPKLRPVGKPLRIARADGTATPAVTGCLGGLVASTPRTFAGDYFVGVNWIRPGPAYGAPEQQFYEDAHEFTAAAAACVGGEALLLIGERGRPGQARTRLRSTSFSCR